jgi:hypothetical protein
MIIADATFDKNGHAQLGETCPPAPDDPCQALELTRRADRPLYDLTIYVGDDDLTFYGISSDGLRSLSAALARLAEAAWEPLL